MSVVKLTRQSENILKEMKEHLDASYWEDRIRQAELDNTDDILWDCFRKLKDNGMIIYEDGDDLISNLFITSKGESYFSEKRKSFLMCVLNIAGIIVGIVIGLYTGVMPLLKLFWKWLCHFF